MLNVEHLCKKYESFSLSDVSFKLDGGYIMGFVGANGAGKSTTIKSILNIVKPDAGKVEILGKDMKASEVEIKQEIGFMLGGADYYPKTHIKKLMDVYKRFFKDFNDKVFNDYMKKFNIDLNKKISELSQGMKVKLSLAMALSHNAKLLIFDEPTSGLDPVARDELLDIFRETVQNGDKSILFSTHITSDLDKCADYIIFIKDGKLIYNSSKDDLLESHYIVQGKIANLTGGVKKRLIGIKENAFGFSGLMLKKDYDENDNLEKAKPNIEEIMIYNEKERAL